MIATIDRSVEIATIGGTVVIDRVQREGQGKVPASDELQAGDVLERPS